MAFSKFLDQIGRDYITGYRWKQRGWITTLNIAGRDYIQQAEIDRFNARAAAGEFAQRNGRPLAKKGQVAA